MPIEGRPFIFPGNPSAASGGTGHSPRHRAGVAVVHSIGNPPATGPPSPTPSTVLEVVHMGISTLTSTRWAIIILCFLVLDTFGHSICTSVSAAYRVKGNHNNMHNRGRRSVDVRVQNPPTLACHDVPNWLGPSAVPVPWPNTWPHPSSLRTTNYHFSI